MHWLCWLVLVIAGLCLVAGCSGWGVVLGLCCLCCFADLVLPVAGLVVWIGLMVWCWGFV